MSTAALSYAEFKDFVGSINDEAVDGAAEFAARIREFQRIAADAALSDVAKYNAVAEQLQQQYLSHATSAFKFATRAEAVSRHDLLQKGLGVWIEKSNGCNVIGMSN